MTTKEKWLSAKPIEQFWQKHRSEPYRNARRLLHCLDTQMAAYGNWYLYEDDNGDCYEEYFSIGD